MSYVLCLVMSYFECSGLWTLCSCGAGGAERGSFLGEVQAPKDSIRLELQGVRPKRWIAWRRSLRREKKREKVRHSLFLKNYGHMRRIMRYIMRYLEIYLCLSMYMR